jgi:hypothetical protein
MSALLGRAARDSTLIAVLGTLDPEAVKILTQARRRGSAAPALALLLDTPTWAGVASAGRDGPCQTAARTLRAAGWRAIVVRQGDTVAQSWSGLLRSRRGSVIARVPAQ